MEKCVVCKELINFKESEDYSKLSEKGCDSINCATKQRGVDLEEVLYSESYDQYVHKKCRSRHTNIKLIQYALKESQPSTSTLKHAKLRSQESYFEYKTHCILCALIVDIALAHRNPERSSYQFSQAMSLELKESLMTQATERNDEWGESVKARLLAIFDLPAEEALYHRDCLKKFMARRATVQIDNTDVTPCKRLQLLMGKKLILTQRFYIKGFLWQVLEIWIQMF